MSAATTPLSVDRIAELEAVLFQRTFKHPVIGHLVEWAPTAWVAQLGNPSPSPTSDLGTWEPNARQVPVEEIFQDMCEFGMRDPFLIGVGRVSRLVRLEAGNQRVGLLLSKGFSRIPVVAYVGDSAVTHVGNGLHQGKLLPLRLPPSTPIMGPYPIKEYLRLSEVLETMPLAPLSQNSCRVQKLRMIRSKATLYETKNLPCRIQGTSAEQGAPTRRQDAA